MSDSSDDEDLSRFRDVIDTSFTELIQESRGSINKGVTTQKATNLKSERYIEEASHYNDVKVPEEMQKRIWAKVSDIIQKNVEFVVLDNDIKKHKIKGGVKLFKQSEEFLSCEDAKDTYTEHHNKEAKKIKNMKRRHVDDVNENDKIAASAISGESILSKKDIKYWKSRRKDKLFKYKGKKNKVLTLVE